MLLPSNVLEAFLKGVSGFLGLEEGLTSLLVVAVSTRILFGEAVAHAGADFEGDVEDFLAIITQSVEEDIGLVVEFLFALFEENVDIDIRNFFVFFFFDATEITGFISGSEAVTVGVAYVFKSFCMQSSMSSTKLRLLLKHCLV